MPDDCIFCKIGQGDMKARKIYEDEKTVGLVDINPRFSWGQCVIFPKEHVKQFYQLEDDDLSSLFLTVKKVAKKIKEVLDPEFVSVFSRGQTVEHAHIILFPAGQNEIIDKFIEMILSYEDLKEKTTDENLNKIQEKLKIE